MKYDIIVVGGGHAGCEASNAASKIGFKTALITSNKIITFHSYAFCVIF